MVAYGVSVTWPLSPDHPQWRSAECPARGPAYQAAQRPLDGFRISGVGGDLTQAAAGVASCQPLLPLRRLAIGPIVDMH